MLNATLKMPQNITLWRILLLTSLVVTIISLVSLVYLQVNISGDGVPNVSQHGPPIEYPWGQAMNVLFITILSTGIAVYSWRRIARASIGGVEDKSIDCTR